MTASGKGTFQPDNDVHITFEDQSRINIFARLNAKSEDLKEELKNKENYLRSIEDADEETQLLDDDEEVAFLVGEVFIYQDILNTQKSLAEQKIQVTNEIEEIKKTRADLATQMSNLKTMLYAKFGSHINLEPDEE